MTVTSTTPNYDRVTRGMRIVQAALGPFVHRELGRALGGQWYTEGVLPSVGPQAQRELPPTGNTKELIDRLDLAALLSVIKGNWRDIFSLKLPKEARHYVDELSTTRNKWAHVGKGDLDEDDAWRALDTMARVLELADLREARDLEKLAQEVRLATYQASAEPTPVIPAPPAASRPRRAGAQGAMEFSLSPWRSVITPHADVAAGRYQQAEFAADLAEVLAGKAEPEYGDPGQFFSRTYLTEGMQSMLVAALERVAGSGGEPVVQLKTAFGGGKTHSMLALYHLLRGKGQLDRRPEIKALIKRAGLKVLPRATLAVMVGTDLDPTRPHLDSGGHGIEVRTLWGEMAAQLGGQEGYALVREADERGVPPGAGVLVDLFDHFGPCVVLIDELVSYTRKLYGVPDLPAGTFERILSFVQELTEAVKRSRASLLIASIPASAMETGGEAGQLVLERIEHTFGRIEAVWKPVGAEEGFEIVRRRLFTPVKDETAQEQVCLAFSRLYAADSPDFPRLCGESAYLERLRAAYPIHPEVFDRLYDDWAGSVERFQRTRGVLRLMAAWIHALWVAGDQSLMIQPGSLPLEVPRVRDELLRYLPEGWNSVVDRDVAGERSEPRRLDEENQRYGQLVAAERVARTIFLGSAPQGSSQRVRGVEAVRVRLGVAQPGESVAVFNDALARLTDVLQYLYVRDQRYWYDTHPNLRRTAEDRASRIEPYEVARELEGRLRRTRERGDFRAVHICPDRSGADVPDERTARLVVLDPAALFRRRQLESAGAAAARHILENRGTSPRQYRNMLAFVAPDAEVMSGLETEVKRFLAWQSIVHDQDPLNLDAAQRKEAADAVKRADETVSLRLQEAYSWLLVPYQDGAGPWQWEEIRIPGTDPGCVERASRQMRAGEHLITRWSPALLRMQLDRWLWNDRPHLLVKQLWEYLCTYGYLPRLQDENVLLTAIADGLAYPDYFAYTRSVSSAGRYEGLIFNQPATPSQIFLDGQSVLLKPEAAQAQREADEARRRQLDEERRRREDVSGGPDGDEHPSPDRDGPFPPPAPPRPKVLRRFHGSLRLNSLRVGRDAGNVAEEIVQHLAGLPGAEVEVTLEINAYLPEGAPDDVVRTVTENAATLRFTTQGFEEE